VAKKKDLSGVLEPNYGSECIMYATGSGWAYGERTTSAQGVTYTDAEASVIAEPADWKRCAEDSCSGAEVMTVCGPVQLAGMGDLVKALTPAPADLAAKLCGDEAAVAELQACLGAAEPVTYEWAETNPVDGDGVVVHTGTPSDGSAPQTITIAEPTTDTNTILTGSEVVDGVVTYTFEDAEGNALPDQTLDLTALISEAHPSLVGGDGIDAVFDATANEWTISTTVVDTFATISGQTVTDADGNSVDVPTGSTYNPATNELTASDGSTITIADDTFATQNADGDLVLADGTVVPLTTSTDTDVVNLITANADGSLTSQLYDNIAGANVGSPTIIPAATDTNVSANKLEFDLATSSLISTVTEDGNDVVGSITMPTRNNFCGDLAIAVDAITGRLALKDISPSGATTYAVVGGTATTLVTDFSSTSTEPLDTYLIGPSDCITITNNSDCKSRRVRVSGLLTGENTSKYTGSTRQTNHRMQFSADGGVTWKFFGSIIKMNYAHTALDLAGFTQRESNSLTSDTTAIILPPNTSADICVRVQHSIFAAYSEASEHDVSTMVTCIVTTEDI